MMRINSLHDWDVSLDEARKLQVELRDRIVHDSTISIKNITKVAAADISFNRYGKTLFGSVVIFKYPELIPVLVNVNKLKVTFPYVPGYLSFREAPVVLDLFKDVDIIPDLLLCDGQGIAHPRGLGLASHLGLFLGIPTIGCAKSKLVGEYRNFDLIKGNYTILRYNSQTVGTVLCTRSGVKPLFVSPGTNITIKDAVDVVIKCSPRFRIPEPLRLAHKIVNDARRKDNKKV